MTNTKPRRSISKVAAILLGGSAAAGSGIATAPSARAQDFNTNLLVPSEALPVNADGSLTFNGQVVISRGVTEAALSPAKNLLAFTYANSGKEGGYNLKICSAAGPTAQNPNPCLDDPIKGSSQLLSNIRFTESGYQVYVLAGDASKGEPTTIKRFGMPGSKAGVNYGPGQVSTVTAANTTISGFELVRKQPAVRGQGGVIEAGDVLANLAPPAAPPKLRLIEPNLAIEGKPSTVQEGNAAQMSGFLARAWRSQTNSPR